MRSLLRKLSGLRRQRGQTTAEYAIIVALVAVSSIAVILLFGNQIRALFTAEGNKLAGDTDVQVDKQMTDDAIGGSIKEWD